MIAGNRGMAAATAGILAALLFGVSTAQSASEPAAEGANKTQPKSPPAGVCPPFRLRDEDGNVIDPAKEENAGKPYSPKMTCGTCHDYDKITKGFHFTQGMGETPTAEQAARCLWASTPGNFGGNWCSPAPLYRHLSPKQNESAVTMDLTAFSFFTSACGTCHPGGGPAEYDREGKRYDRWMSDPKSGFTSKGDNNFDGDYYQARWTETGVLEADCLLCHMPEYDFGQRRKQLGAWNFRWAASAGSKFASVKGSIQKGEPVEIAYNKELFNPDGTIELHIVREPRNEACLSCHAQPSWKKRGANFSPRTDVHLRAGLKCVDCHPAGSSATDPRIARHEEHQFGKGDDPGGLVRDDLDNTVVSCSDCHDTGRLGAPLAKHRGLPPLHLEQIACQTCHIPERLVMSIEVQASDVFNTVPKIDQPGKRLWSFYGPDWEFRNHYGYLHMMGYDDKPTERFRPKLVRYKGKIYPANRIHSAWPGIEIEGETALMQPKMSDIVKMWMAHRSDPAAKYSELARIADDNGDGAPEVNRVEEIDALIHSVTQMLTDIQYPLQKKRVVWVMDDRVYRSGAEYRVLPKRDWEASPYANVHKYSHDIFPSEAARGSNGCTDCHSFRSAFFYAPVLKHLFDENAKSVVEPQYQRLGFSGVSVALGAWRESVLKRVGLWVPVAVVLLCLFHLVIFGTRRVSVDLGDEEVVRHRPGERLAHALGLVSFVVLALTGCSFLLGNGNPLGDTARTVHEYVGWFFAAAVVAIFFFWLRSGRFAAHDWRWLRYLGGYFGFGGALPAGKFNAGQKIYFWFVVLCGLGLFATGVLMSFRDGVRAWLPLAYTIHDGLAILFVSAVVAHFYLAVVAVPGALRAILEGKVSTRWAQHHHPEWLEEAADHLQGRDEGPQNT